MFSQVSRFLVVNPQGRCTADEALAHPFFQQYVVEEVRHFSPRGKFKVLRLDSGAAAVSFSGSRLQTLLCSSRWDFNPFIPSGFPIYVPEDAGGGGNGALPRSTS